jgi:thiosulfate dehydrogenase
LLASFTLLAAQYAVAAYQGEVPGDAVRGGLIYDNWMLALDLAPPAGDHPLWANQDANTRSGVITWRCSSCHGWDYKGADGTYGAYSSFYTGFTGLEDMVGASQEEVIDWLDGTNNPEHNFLAYTNSTALNNLAAFLRTQQIDTSLLINPETGESLGDRERGSQLYRNSCAGCHGSSGAAMNFGTTIDPLYLGDLALSDPWQTVHKIRFGTATNVRMPASEDQDWSLSMVADVLAFLQTLPRGNPDFEVLSSEPDPTQVDAQGQIEPIVWATFAIVMVVAGSVTWQWYQDRKEAKS